MVYAILHNLPPLVMAFNVQENAVFIPEFSKNLPTVGGAPSPPPPPPPYRSLRSLALAPCWQILAAPLSHAHESGRRALAPPPPPTVVYAILHNLPPIVMAFNVEENAVFIPEFSKISLPWEGEALPHPQ